jgi:hypothetical protein
VATIAVIFDFDDTLVPDSTTKLLATHGIDPNEFWGVQAKALIQKGFDPPLAYLRLLLERIGSGRELGEMTNDDLASFGATLDSDFFPGLPELFDDLRETVREIGRDLVVEFYIISGGLEDIVLGSRVVQDNFEGVYGCRLAPNDDSRILRHIARCITFTEKTRYIFEINKGIRKDESLRDPYGVNKAVPRPQRRIPFKNMIYVGDGLTDIPCFSLMTSEGGLGFAVFDPTRATSAKRALEEFLIPARVVGSYSPRYRKDDDLGSLLRAAVANIGSGIFLRRGEAEPEE